MRKRGSTPVLLIGVLRMPAGARRAPPSSGEGVKENNLRDERLALLLFGILRLLFCFGLVDGGSFLVFCLEASVQRSRNSLLVVLRSVSLRPLIRFFVPQGISRSSISPADWARAIVASICDVSLMAWHQYAMRCLPQVVPRPSFFFGLVLSAC